MSAPDRQRTILVVDDQADLLQAASMILAVTGYEVLTADSGTAALDLAARERPDAILLDVLMPGLDGPEVLARLREDPATASIPVVFLTGKSQPPDRARLEGLGAAGTIAKPFHPAALGSEMARILGWPEG